MASEIHDTENQILITACKLFAERGFDKVTHREIAKESGQNSALINYYFRSKDNLFKKALEYCHKLTMEKYNPICSEEIVPLDGIKLIVRARLMTIFDEGPAGWFPKIAVHEMSAFSSDKVSLIRRFHSPIHERVKALISKFLEEDEESLLVKTSCHNIITQWVMMNKGRFKGRGLFAEGGIAPEDVETVISNIIEFIVGGLEHLKRTRRTAQKVKK